MDGPGTVRVTLDSKVEARPDKALLDKSGKSKSRTESLNYAKTVLIAIVLIPVKSQFYLRLQKIE